MLILEVKYWIERGSGGKREGKLENISMSTRPSPVPAAGMSSCPRPQLQSSVGVCVEKGCVRNHGAFRALRRIMLVRGVIAVDEVRE